MEWSYKSNTNKSTGYEDVMDKISSVTHEKFMEMNDDEKDKAIDYIFNIIREKNIFPIYYFNHDGIIEEILKCVNKDVELKDNLLNEKSLCGQYLCNFLFPNLHQVNCKNDKNNSMYDRFFDDHKLKRTIKFVLTYETIKNSYSGIYRSARLIGGNVATNFYPMKAKALYEKYCPKNGIVYDFACGFGGRMLGCLTSKNNYRYYGVDPCIETYENLNKLGKYIEEATGRNNIFKVYCKGSEEYCCKENYCDFAFSSPPYFSLEKYSNEDTQCYNKYPNICDWFKGYVEPTIKNIYTMLKPNCYYAVNIADFNLGNKRVEYVNKWIEISEQIGFKYVETVSMKVETRKGYGHNGDKQEGIFVFKKS